MKKTFGDYLFFVVIYTLYYVVLFLADKFYGFEVAVLIGIAALLAKVNDIQSRN